MLFRSGEKRPSRLTPNASLDLPDRPEVSRDQGLESPLTLKQKRDLLKKSPAVPDSSVDDMCPEAGVALGSSPSGRTIFLDIPEDTAVPLTPEHPDNSNGDEEEEEDEEDYELGDEDDSDLKPEDEDDEDEAEFKIQIVPRQRKQRKIAVSAIQREYLDISFNTLDKLGVQAAEAGEEAGAGRQGG